MRKSLLTQVVAAMLIAATQVNLSDRAEAVGILYSDPGWAFAYDGNEAFYNDPDGPNPDYLNGTDQNLPGGRSGTAALVDPGSGNPPHWIHWGQQWDGSAPGDPLGGTPTGALYPPLPPPAPGGVAAYTGTDSATYLRIQDPGFPNSYGWPDKGAQVGPGAPRQEGNNRRMLFGHDIAGDPAFSGSTAVIDNGITLTFRIRLATRATGPLDDIFLENGLTLANTASWPADGLGYEVSNNGRGMLMLTQSRPVGGFSQMAFSLLDDNTVNNEGLAANVGTKRGLIMNNRWSANQSVNTNDATPATTNVFEIPHEDLDQWQEFWITVVQMPAPVGGNTHEVNVYHNGSLTPQTFQTFLSPENEFDGSAFLGMGLSSDSRQGAFDLDFIAYKEGVHVPTLVPQGLAGDYNDNGVVDAADYVLWRKNNNTNNPLTNDDDLGTPITTAHYDLWKANFGQSSPGSGGGSLAAVPEPSPAVLAWLSTVAVGMVARRPRHSVTT